MRREHPYSSQVQQPSHRNKITSDDRTALDLATEPHATRLPGVHTEEATQEPVQDQRPILSPCCAAARQRMTSTDERSCLANIAASERC